MSTRMMAAIATALVISSGSVFAAAMDHDPTTAVSALAKKGSSKHTSPSHSNARRQTSPSSLGLLENRPARAIPVVAPVNVDADDKAGGVHW
jgi:PAB1-binding protein PBP1